MGTLDKSSIIQSDWDVILKGKEALLCIVFIVTWNTIYELQKAHKTSASICEFCCKNYVKFDWNIQSFLCVLMRGKLLIDIFHTLTIEAADNVVKLVNS